MEDLQKSDHCTVDLTDRGGLNTYDDEEEEEYEDCDNEDGGSGISLPEVTCLCCYEVLLDPTTLPCGHSFCLHCLVMWLQTSGRNVCPTCRKAWWTIPKVNISFRDLVEKRFQAAVARRRQNIMADPQIVHAVLAFQHAEHIVRHQPAPPRMQWWPWLCSSKFLSGVFLTLSFVAVVFLLSQWSGMNGKSELLVKKSLDFWTSEDVLMWMQDLGEWTSPYREVFFKEKVNGRLLNVVEEKDLLKTPYQIENELHRRTMLQEIRRVQELGFKQPKNFWEYKAVNEGRSLFLLFGLTDSPRLTMLYLYFFDYYDSFLPLIQTTCPAPLKKDSEETLSYRNLESPNWNQWFVFGVKFFILPYQLISDFAWEWMDVHTWTSWIIMWHSLMLTLRDGIIVWKLRGHFNRRTILQFMFIHMKLVALSFVGLVLWNLLPQFVWNCIFNWCLYFVPFSTTLIILFPNIQALLLNKLRHYI